MPVYPLGNRPDLFPDPRKVDIDPSGLIAVGGDLSPRRLMAGYHQGIFPWYSPGDPILWWCPDPRAVILPQHFHLSRSLGKWRRQGRYQVTVDQDFISVINGCAAPRPESPGTWIVPEMKAAYIALHREGHAHSVEVHANDRLVGGLYGVLIGRMFFAESMFSRAPNASKFALAALLVDNCLGPLALLDCQFATEHLLSLGAEEWPRARFLNHAQAAMRAVMPNRETKRSQHG
ncbi:MAG: leucyl/phenylalanyl-tRNA--protein transferase [Halothiobacillaceae bacterium]